MKPKVNNLGKASKPKTLQIIISAVSAIYLCIHFLWPDLKVDSITIALFVISIVPWLFPLFKSLELPGGWKIEFQDAQDAKEKAERAGLIIPSDGKKRSDLAFLEISDRDVNLGLAGLRIEIEKRLMALAEKNDIRNQRRGLSVLLRDLGNNGVLSHDELSALLDITTILNSAIHGSLINHDTATYTLDFGLSLLNALDKKLKGDK